MKLCWTNPGGLRGSRDQRPRSPRAPPPRQDRGPAPGASVALGKGVSATGDPRARKDSPCPTFMTIFMERVWQTPPSRFSRPSSVPLEVAARKERERWGGFWGAGRVLPGRSLLSPGTPRDPQELSTSRGGGSLLTPRCSHSFPPQSGAHCRCLTHRLLDFCTSQRCLQRRGCDPSSFPSPPHPHKRAILRAGTLLPL